jgi:ABC-type branched-subunit amino acid transport system ATPase component
MRIGTLELIRYGKFTDHAVEFPAAEQDFHFVVGPNEAGKSTIKNAIKPSRFIARRAVNRRSVRRTATRFPPTRSRRFSARPTRASSSRCTASITRR